MASMRSGGANRAKEFLPILLESNNKITFAAIDIMIFLVSAWVMSGVLAPFSMEKLFRAMNALSTVRPAKRSLLESPPSTVQWNFLRTIPPISTTLTVSMSSSTRAIASRRRREIQGEWVLGLAGIGAVIFGVVVLAFPAAGAFALVWMVAFYAIASGVLAAQSLLEATDYDALIAAGCGAAIPYGPHTDADRARMLVALGLNSIDQLFDDIPAALHASRLDLPDPEPELELAARLSALAARNRTDLASFLGAGVYRHWSPPTVDQILLRGEWYTAYPPYQPEISQGTLQRIYEYESLIAELVGLDVVSASHYDGAAATAEAAGWAAGRGASGRWCGATWRNAFPRRIPSMTSISLRRRSAPGRSALLIA